MYQLIWKLFLETGDIETYLLLKSIENEHPTTLGVHDPKKGEEDQAVTEQLNI